MGLTFICNIHTVLRMKSVGNKNLANIARSSLQPQTVYIKCYYVQRFAIHARDSGRLKKWGRKTESIFDFTSTYKMSAF